MNKLILFFVLQTLLLSTFADTWIEDFAEVKKNASENKRDIIMIFTGSDWCPPCIRLKKEVLDKKEFLNYAKGKLNLAVIDFPSRKKIEDRIKKQNKKLAEKFSIEGYPTLIFCNYEGIPYGQDYPETPTALIESIKKAQEKINKYYAIIKDLKEKSFNETETKEKAMKAYELIPQDYKSFYKHLDEIAKNNKVVKQILELNISYSSMIEKMKQEYQGSGDINEVKTILESYITKSKDVNFLQKSLFIELSFYNYKNENDLKKIKEVLQKIITLDDKSSLGKRASKILNTDLPKTLLKLKEEQEQE